MYFWAASFSLEELRYVSESELNEVQAKLLSGEFYTQDAERVFLMFS
jgi:hypothetical protein